MRLVTAVMLLCAACKAPQPVEKAPATDAAVAFDLALPPALAARLAMVQADVKQPIAEQNATVEAQRIADALTDVERATREGRKIIALATKRTMESDRDIAENGPRTATGVPVNFCEGMGMSWIQKLKRESIEAGRDRLPWSADSDVRDIVTGCLRKVDAPAREKYCALLRSRHRLTQRCFDGLTAAECSTIGGYLIAACDNFK